MTSGTRSTILWPIVLLLVAPLGQTLRSETFSPREYRLRFYHTHTNERLDIVYRRGETYLPESLAKLDHYLRDSRTGDVHHFDPRLFDLLYDLTSSVGDDGGEIDVVCGYRTPASNEFLRTRGANTASPSTVSTCRRKPSTFGCRELPPPECGMPLCTCSAAVLATIGIPISSMWTWDPYATGKLAFRLSLRIRMPLGESLLQGCRVRRYRQRSGPAHLPAR
jgi:uncharacterized protein YcbK (DUF882 family)